MGDEGIRPFKEEEMVTRYDGAGPCVRGAYLI